MTVVDTPRVDPTMDGPQLLFEEARQRRKRRRWILGGMAAVALVVAVSSGLLIVTTSGRGTPTQRTSRGPTPVAKIRSYPKQMVVVDLAASQRLELISSATGHVLRNLTSDVGTFDGTTQPTVTPTGTVYFDHAGRAGTQPSEQIWSVPLSGGQSAFVADGHTPVVSPNGAFLAYLTWTALTNAPASVVVMNIATGATTTWTYSTNVPELSDLSWAPNSQSLVFTTSTPSSRTSWTYGAWSIPLLSPNRSLDAAQPIRLLPNAFWVGYVNSTQAMEVLVHRNFLDQGDWFQPIVMDVASGQVIKRLSVLSGQSEGPPNGSGLWQIDPTGHYVAFIKLRSLPNGAGTVSDLYRWSINASPSRSTGRPVIVKRDVWSLAWVPGS